MRVVLVEDHKLERETLAKALTDASIEVVGQAQDAPGALNIVDEVAPDVVLLDLKLSQDRDAEGLEVAKTLRARQPEVGLLVLSAYEQPAYAERLLSLPGGSFAVGYVLKGGSGGLDELIDAIRRVARREVVLDPIIIRSLMSRPRLQNDPLKTLSPQERHVLELLAQGLSNLGIAQQLRCRISTVESHVSTIFSKLGLSAGSEHERRGQNTRVKAALMFLSHSRPHHQP